MAKELKLKLLPCPVPWCNKTLQPSVQQYPINKHVLCPSCLTKGPSSLYESEAIAAWNSRPVSELERLAREVIKEYARYREECRWVTTRQVDRFRLNTSIEALAAFLDQPRR